jgi:hypothetical protein
MTAAPTTAPFHNKLPPASLMRAINSPAGKDSRLQPPRIGVAEAMELPLDIDFAGVLHNFPLLTVKEAATELKCSDQQIRNFIDDGKLLAFPINLAEGEGSPAGQVRKRAIYRIVRKTAAQAFTFLTAAQRTQLANETIRTVNDWLFAPFNPDIGGWLPSLRIGARSALNVIEAAQAVRCDGDHIRNLYQHGLISGADVGRSELLHLRVSRSSLAAFVTRRLARQNNIEL